MGDRVTHQWWFSDGIMRTRFLDFCRNRGVTGTTSRQGKKTRVTTNHKNKSALQKFTAGWAAHSVVKE